MWDALHSGQAEVLLGEVVLRAFAKIEEASSPAVALDGD